MRRLFILTLITLTTLLTGCSLTNQDENLPTQNQDYTFVDALNEEVTVKKNIDNVVSLFGSYAEIWEQGGGKLVGVTDDALERDILKSENLTIVGNTKTPNIELILSLKPDLILLNPNISEQLEISKVLKESGIPCAFFDVELFEDYLNMLNIVTDITEQKDLYQQNGIEIQDNIDQIISTTQVEGKKVLLLRAFSSGVKARNSDNMTGQMLQAFQTVNITDIYPSLLEDLSTEIILKEDPDYIFVTTMGTDTEKAIQNVKDMIINHPAYANIKAIKETEVHVLPKDLFHYKPNQRWDEAYEYLANTFK